LQRNDAPINLEVCDALYDMNRFESAKAELHDNARLFTGNKSKMFEQRLEVVRLLSITLWGFRPDF